MSPLILFLTSIQATPPLCREASHDRLVVQAGRDVCAGALSAKGEPRTPGFLPTSCADPDASYRVDARRRVDLCLPAKGSAA
jgi:hypothetical protein